MLVREAIERFDRGLVGQGASRNTVATYRRNLERFAGAFAEREVEEVKTADLMAMRSSGNRKQRSG